MTLAALERPVRAGQLKAEAPAAEEIAALVRSGETRLKDATNPELALESRFDLAYNAAHALSLAALRFHGYRSENRYLVFQALAHTIGLASEKWRVLDDAHRKRNSIEYEGVAHIDDQLVAAIIRVAGEVGERVREIVNSKKS